MADVQGIYWMASEKIILLAAIQTYCISSQFINLINIIPTISFARHMSYTESSNSYWHVSKRYHPIIQSFTQRTKNVNGNIDTVQLKLHCCNIRQRHLYMLGILNTLCSSGIKDSFDKISLNVLFYVENNAPFGLLPSNIFKKSLCFLISYHFPLYIYLHVVLIKPWF